MFVKVLQNNSTVGCEGITKQQHKDSRKLSMNFKNNNNKKYVTTMLLFISNNAINCRKCTKSKPMCRCFLITPLPDM